MHYLYRIMNKINGKIYIGQSLVPHRRWSAHKSASKNLEKSTQYIHHSMAKHGIDNFIFEVICSCKTQENANYIEDILIKQYNSRNKEMGYNIQPGGNTSSPSEETKQKMRDATLKQIAEKGHPAQGHKWNDESRQKLSESLKAVDKEKWYTPEVRKNMSQAHLGKIQSEEQIAKKVSSYAKTVEKRKENQLLTGEIKCNAPDCNKSGFEHKYKHVNDIRYCLMHAKRIEKFGNLDKPLSATLGKAPPNKIEFTEDQIKQILSDKTIVDLCKELNIGEKAIVRIRKENNYQKPENITSEQIKIIQESKLSLRQLSKDLGLNRKLITKIKNIKS